MTFADQIRVRISELPFGDPASPERVPVSRDVATLPDDADGAARLFEAADANLYRAKASGRNRVVAEAR